ncbi:permease [Candidatus Galacturonibacter soehngenii]|uniref:Permease n=1 Tax=Candidatus Galacturonatibacter soehngenii TaxID=2307010 RepID=A0A7V7UCU8_9FIRM|nr:permease [Candidatus Galacturonibacter soehngenii]KAB1440030.1 permease [Candidatus Galacturonibacter soehngenii]
MKNNTILLLKLLLMNQFKINQLKDRSKKRVRIVLMGVVILLLSTMLIIYSYGIGYSLGMIGIAKVIPSYALTTVGIITLFFTVFKSNGILFGTTDYESLMSLPIKTSEIIASRFLHMYLMNTYFAFLVMAPLGFVYVIFEKPATSFAFIWIVGMFFSTLFPTTLATIIGGIIAFISSHFKYTNALSILLSFILVVGILLSSIGLGGMDESVMQTTQLSKLFEMLSKELHTIYPLSRLFEKAVVNKSWFSFVGFLAFSIAIYLLFIKILSLQYKKINTAILSFQAKSNYKIKKMKISGIRMALYKKELKRFFSSYAYVLNIGIGAVMALIMAISVFVLQPATLEKALEMTNLEPLLSKVIAFAFSMVLCMSCTTSVALSLEGKNLWILKSLPISTKTILDSKMLVNLTITLPVSIIFGTLMNVKFETDIITRTFFYVIPITYSFFIAVWGMFINIKLPNYEWTSETAVIKQGIASMLGMLLGPIFALIPLGAVLLLPSISYQLIQIATVILILILIMSLYRYIASSKI